MKIGDYSSRPTMKEIMVGSWVGEETADAEQIFKETQQMKDRERYHQMFDKEDGLRKEVRELEAKLPGLQAEADTLDAEARRQELLDDRGAKSARADADKAQVKVDQAREALRKGKEDVSFLAQMRGKFRQAIRDELLQRYKDQYAVQVKAVYAKLLAAHEAIQALSAIRDAADREAGDVGPVQLTPQGRGNIEFALTLDQLEEFKKRAGMNGYAIN